MATALAPSAKAAAEFARIEKARLALGVSRAEVCRAANVSLTVYSKAYRGLRGVRVGTLERLVGGVERLAHEKRLRAQRLAAVVDHERSAA